MSNVKTKLERIQKTRTVLNEIRWDMDGKTIRTITDFFTKIGEQHGFDCTLDIEAYEDYGCSSVRMEVQKKTLETDEELAARQLILDNREAAQHIEDLEVWKRVQASMDADALAGTN